MNRLTPYFERAEEPQEPNVPDTFVVVETAQYRICVSVEVGRAIERIVDRRWGKRWLVFTDLFGFRRRILRSAVDCISDSTPASRAAARAFCRDREREEKADRRLWEEED